MRLFGQRTGRGIAALALIGGVVGGSAVLIVAAPAGAATTTLYAYPDADVNPGYTSAACGQATTSAGGPCTLTQALALANANSTAATPYTIDLATYTSSNTFSGPLTITASNIAIDGSGVSAGAVVSGSTSTVITVNSGASAVTIENLTVSGGHGGGTANSADAGGISNAGDLTLNNVTVSHNDGGSCNGQFACSGGPGGVSNTGTMVVSGSTIENNAGGFGTADFSYPIPSVSGKPGGLGGAGGIYNGGKLALSLSSIVNNTGGDGGRGGSGGPGQANPSPSEFAPPCLEYASNGGAGGAGGPGGVYVADSSSLTGDTSQVGANTGGSGGSGGLGGPDGINDHGQCGPGNNGGSGPNGVSTIREGVPGLSWTSAPPSSANVGDSFPVTAQSTGGGSLTVGANSGCGPAEVPPPDTSDNFGDLTASESIAVNGPGGTSCSVTASVSDNGWFTAQTLNSSMAMLDADLSLSQANNITVPATSTSGAVVTYAAPTASDPDDTGATLSAPTCTPGSGSTFPVGQTPVTCTVTDSDDANSSVSTSFTVTVVAPPSISMAFGATSIPLYGQTALTFTITNPNPSAGLTGVGFSDPLPAGLGVATPSDLTNSCGGTVTGSGSTITLSGGGVAAAGSCTIMLDVVATGPEFDVIPNTTTAVSSNEGGTGNTASSSLTVVVPPSFSMQFRATSFPFGGQTPLFLTILNFNDSALSGIGFSDTLPAGLVVSTPSGLTSSCGGTTTAVAGSSSVSLSGGALIADGLCTITLNVTGVAVGTQTNTTSPITSNEGGAGNAASASIIIQAPQAITFTNVIPNPALVGASFTAKATGGGSGNAVLFSVDTTQTTNNACALGTDGVTVSLNHVGSCVIEATQAGNAYYVATANSETITVGKATPTVTWSNPSAITWGTALSATQLDATASVPGTFVYTPPAGTVLGPGNNQSLSVTFVPADSADYNSVTKSVSINVVFNPAACITKATSGPLTVSAGQAYCVGAGATITNGVTVKAGGALYITGGTIKGSLNASGASAISICGVTVTGGITISGTSGPVAIGGSNCKNMISGSVSITNNTGGLSYQNNTVAGSLTITNNSGPLGTISSKGTTGSVTISKNT